MLSFLHSPTLTSIHDTGKTTALTRQTFVGKVTSLLFNMLSRLVITFLPRIKCLLISWLQSPSAVIFEPPKIKSDTVSTVSPSICHEVMGPDAIILVFWMLSFKPTFSLSSFTFIMLLDNIKTTERQGVCEHGLSEHPLKSFQTRHGLISLKYLYFENLRGSDYSPQSTHVIVKYCLYIKYY